VTPCIWLGTTHPCNPPNYDLWVNLLFFMMCIYKHCFPPMLLVFAMKCCTKIPCPLPHNRYCCLLSSPMCLPHLLISTCLISSPITYPLSSVLCCLIAFFLLFFDICYNSLWLHFGLFVYIFLSVFLYHFILAVCLICVCICVPFIRHITSWTLYIHVFPD